MPLFGKPVTSLTESDLVALQDNSVEEGRTIDYKRELPGNADKEKKELLADVSAFANAEGGHLVFGIEETNGVPATVEGVAIENVDAEILRLDQAIRTGIAPRIPNLAVVPVTLSNGNTIVVVEIPRSWLRPHMVTFKGTNRFYVRHSRNSEPMTVDELRTAFALADTAGQRVRDFRLQRLSALKRGDAPIMLEDGPTIVLHLLPLAMHDPNHQVDIADPDGSPRYLTVLDGSSRSHRINFDGVFCYDPSQDRYYGYTQLYRSGAVEATQTDIISHTGKHDGVKYLDVKHLERVVITSTNRYLQSLRNWGVQLPIIVGLSVLHAKGYTVLMGRPLSSTPRPKHMVDRRHLIVPEVLIDTYDCDIAELLRPSFDAIWNAAGWIRSPNYNQSGKYTG